MNILNTVGSYLGFNKTINDEKKNCLSLIESSQNDNHSMRKSESHFYLASILNEP